MHRVVEERLRCKVLSSTVDAFGAIKQNPDLGSVLLTQPSSLADCFHASGITEYKFS